MAFGSYCWADGCADKVHVRMRDDIPRVPVEEGDEVVFHLPFDPSEVVLTLVEDRSSTWQKPQRQVPWEVSRFGIVHVAAWPHGDGDASYLVELVERPAAAPR